LFDRPEGGERAILVHISFTGIDDGDAVRELEALAESAGAEIVATVFGSRSTPDPRYFVGKGKAEEIGDRVGDSQAELVIFDHALSPSQERNLERLLGCRVLDRNGLILDIFAQRARTFEGKLQVELAQLRHVATRLVRGWTHLERQKGGIGLRGPGETQLETDRRLIGVRIKQLNRRLERVRSRRGQGRRARRRAQIPTVSLVGYTNAGKSTLFNRLTGAGVYSADQLFATLDPTLRRLSLADGIQAVLVDTVGFISHLPHELVAAFHSTLQETVEADLLLHVVDASDPERDAHIAQVNAVLEEIGALEVPRILVYNKIDTNDRSPRSDRDEDGQVNRVWVSAHTGVGMDLLEGALVERFRPEMVHTHVHLPPAAARARARLFELGAVVGEQVDSGGGFTIEVRCARDRFEDWRRREGLEAHSLPPQEG
jgi:GTP-binding protein HflX